MNGLLVGHSFIRRLGRSVGHSSELLSNFGLGFHQCEVTLHGVRGGTLRKLQEDTVFAEKIRSLRPRIVIVQLGGNDLCIPNTRPEVFACELTEWREWMQTLMGQHVHIKHVFICELFVRQITRGVNVQTYEKRRTTTTNYSISILQPSKEGWDHQRRKQILPVGRVKEGGFQRRQSAPGMTRSMTKALQILQCYSPSPLR